MQILIYLSMVVVMVIPILIFNWKRKQEIIQSSKNSKLHFFLHLLVGVFFGLTIFMFTTFDQGWGMFSLLHLYGFIATFILAVALAYLVKGTNKAKTVALIMCAIILISPIARPFIYLGPENYMGNGLYRTYIADFEYAFPFQLCNIAALIYVFALLVPATTLFSKVVKNFMITIGFLGGIVNNIQAWYLELGGFWHFVIWETYILHVFIMVIPIFIVLTDQIEFDLKHVLYNMIWIAPLFILMGLVINPIMGLNYWFTAPFNVLYLIPHGIYFPWMGTTIYPVYMLLLFLLISLACVLFHYGFKLLHKKITPYFI